MFVISITCLPFNADWLANFWRWENLVGLLEFDIPLSEILLAACADKLLQDLNSIKSCSAYSEQKAAVKTVSDACSILAI